MRVIGLTGGIASGKSTVSGLLKKEYGAVILDADEAARAIAEPEAPLWRAYVERYGKERVLRPDGTLDREAVAEIVFHDAEEKAWMDKTAHPLIQRALTEQMEACRTAGEKAVVLDVPLLYEVGWEKLAGEVWVVYVDEATQLQRLMKRNALSEDEARARIASQMSMKEKKRRADVVIDNGGTREETAAQVRAAFEGRLSKEK